MAIDPKLQLPGGAGTTNEQLFDGLIRHQIGLMRLSGSVRERVNKLLDATEKDIAAKIKSKLAGTRGLSSPSAVRKLQSLLKSIQSTRSKAWGKVDKAWAEDISELAAAEPKMVDGIFKTTVPVVLNTTLPSAQLLQDIVDAQPFEGKTLSEWAASVQRADLSRIEDQIKIGMVQGENPNVIAQRIVGTVRQRGRDGVTEITRRAAAGISRTAVNAVSNSAKRAYYELNKDIIKKELYVATLDGVTTPICRSLDGKTFPVGEGPIPPLHFNCRSVRVAVLEGQKLGNRPTRRFTESSLVREFRKKNNLGVGTNRSDLPRGFKGKFDDFAAKRIRELTGTTPAKVNYGTWLNRQSAQFQDDVLGKTRGKLFRRGGLKLDRFVNRAGDEIPLSQLVRTDREAFIRAGLDPEDFFR